MMRICEEKPVYSLQQIVHYLKSQKQTSNELITIQRTINKGLVLHIAVSI